MDIQIKQGPQCHPSNCYTYRNGVLNISSIHFTSNNGDTALNTCNLFQRVQIVVRLHIILSVMTEYINLYPINGRRGLSVVQKFTNTRIVGI